MLTDTEAVKELKKKEQRFEKFKKYRAEAFLFQREKKICNSGPDHVESFKRLTDGDLPVELDLNYLYKIFVKCKAELKANQENEKNLKELKETEAQLKRNENAQSMKQKLDNDKRQELIAAGKAIKEEIATLEAKLKETEEQLEEAARQIPNMVHPETPIGKLDTENLEVKVSGTPRKFDFEPKDHVQIAETLDILDFDRATKVSGPKFYYLKNEAVFLEQALIILDTGSPKRNV